jgi:hypothetical protein
MKAREQIEAAREQKVVWSSLFFVIRLEQDQRSWTPLLPVFKHSYFVEVKELPVSSQDLPISSCQNVM